MSRLSDPPSRVTLVDVLHGLAGLLFGLLVLRFAFYFYAGTVAGCDIGGHDARPLCRQADLGLGDGLLMLYTFSGYGLLLLVPAMWRRSAWLGVPVSALALALAVLASRDANRRDCKSLSPGSCSDRCAAYGRACTWGTP